MTTTPKQKRSPALKHPDLSDYLKKILTAKVYDIAQESPLEQAKLLSKRMRNKILLKEEDYQSVFSFKLRGAYNKMAHLSKQSLECGVICASAGNHAQGVALAAQQLGCRAVIVMPVTTPQVKVDAVKHLGGEAVLFGDSYSDAAAHAQQLAEKQHLTFVHPFDDPYVIAGQGTIAMEILRQHQGPLDAIFVPIGGGGLIAGVAAYIKAVRPDIKIIGVQMNDSDAMMRSVRQGRRITLPDVGLFSDGTAVKQVGEETFRLARALVDDFVVVDTDAVCAAIKDVFQDTRNIVEPSGAMSVAAVKQYITTHKIRGGTFVSILSGANMNFDRLRFVAERAQIGEKREALFAVTIPEQPGSFKRFCEVIGSRSVTEFNYRISRANQAQIFTSIATSGAEGESDKITAQLKRAGFPTLDMSDDELAKEHIRYMVGGKGELAKDERLLRFTFPERPGALMKFLSSMSPTWNISLFHYRNSGADFGRILVGIQVPRKDNALFKEFLTSLAYPWEEETKNPVYQLFLR
ncbi:threonine ammonia-lyase, biosynthetic [Saezia sanguinis]|uniref:threonine ammonia-lyase, biosynthetic n=1 Tax=Saezia sanguinis TaxID=1965230 RepID=UPI0030436BEA